uniref:Proopiomelanocortin b n=1 Tax=Rhamdia quelen TaxID=162147 RepID=A0A218KE56_RHAQU|nr:proopiomelanocortin b [Rhamdia quelen]
MIKMQCVFWFAAVVLLCVCGSVVDQQCWGITDCSRFDSQEKIIECMWQCRMKQRVSTTETLLLNQQPEEREEDEDEEEGEEEDSVSLGILLSALTPPDVSEDLSTRPQRSEERPTYFMEHFRWGKPTSRKRRPVKVHTTFSMDDEGQEEPSVEPPFPPLTRRQTRDDEEREQKKNTDAKSSTKYRITHFRWSAPPASKRYGGFMKSWSESSNKPLLTLLRNIMAKNGQ